MLVAMKANFRAEGDRRPSRAWSRWTLPVRA